VSYTPPYKITTKILRLVTRISEKISDIKHIEKDFITPKLRRKIGENIIRRSVRGE
jgi:hypothetical protein